MYICMWIQVHVCTYDVQMYVTTYYNIIIVHVHVYNYVCRYVHVCNYIIIYICTYVCKIVNTSTSMYLCMYWICTCYEYHMLAI